MGDDARTPALSSADTCGWPDLSDAMATQELADLLRDVHFAMKHARTALVAFDSSDRFDLVRRDVERLSEAMKAIDAALVGAPDPLPLTPEQEARAKEWIGRALRRIDDA